MGGIGHVAVFSLAIGMATVALQPGEQFGPQSAHRVTLDPAAAPGAAQAPPRPLATPVALATITDPYQLVPLALGRRWTYDLTLDLAERNTPVRREGEFSVTIMAVTETEGAPVFEAKIDGHPLLDGWSDRQLLYVVLDDRLYELRVNTYLDELVRQRGQVTKAVWARHPAGIEVDEPRST